MPLSDVTTPISPLAAPPATALPGVIRLRIDPGWTYHDAWLRASPIQREFVELANFNWEEGVQETQSVNYDHEQIVGRAEPYIVYQSTDALNFTFPFTLHADGDNLDTDIDRVIANDVIGPYNFLLSLKQPFRLPAPGGNVSHAPPPVLLTFGKYFTVRGVVTDLSGNAHEVFDSLTLRPHRIDCSITIQAVRRSLPDFYDGSRVFA